MKNNLLFIEVLLLVFHNLLTWRGGMGFLVFCFFFPTQLCLLRKMRMYSYLSSAQKLKKEHVLKG